MSEINEITEKQLVLIAEKVMGWQPARKEALYGAIPEIKGYTIYKGGFYRETYLGIDNPGMLEVLPRNYTPEKRAEMGIPDNPLVLYVSSLTSWRPHENLTDAWMIVERMAWLYFHGQTADLLAMAFDFRVRLRAANTFTLLAFELCQAICRVAVESCEYIASIGDF